MSLNFLVLTGNLGLLFMSRESIPLESPLESSGVQKGAQFS